MIQPPGDKVFLKPLRAPDMIGSIVVPDQAMPRVNQGTVMYKGPKCSPDLKEGDHVLFSAYSGTMIYLEDEGELIAMSSRYIICIIEDDPTDVPGLYLRDKEGNYFPATYESSIELATRALRKNYRFLKFKDELSTKPTKQELDTEMVDDDE